MNHSFIVRSAFFIFLLNSAIIFSQKISTAELKVIQTIETNNEEAINFLEKIVNINSGTMNHKGVKQVGMVFRDAFDEIDFQTNWIDLSEVNRSGHLFAETKKSQNTTGKKLLLIRHLDIVFEEDRLFK